MAGIYLECTMPAPKLFRLVVLAATFACLRALSSKEKVYPNYRIEEDEELFWLEDATKTLNDKLAQIPNLGVAHNVVFFLGDGMGLSTVTAGRIYKGQRRGASGEEAVLDFEKLPFTGLSKTYSVDRQTADSAATATAYMCGVKTNNDVVGVTAKVQRGDCAAASRVENRVESVLAWAQASGKWTGLVTTDSVTGASAAAGYAHSADRAYTSSVPKGCHAKDIAEQLIHGEVGSRLRVVFGGGRSDFLPNRVRPPGQRMIEGDDLPINHKGSRTDGRNLIEEYLQRHGEEDTRAAFVWTRDHLDQLDDPRYAADRVLGLFATGRLAFALDASAPHANASAATLAAADQPSLAEMTLAAIKTLSRAPRGFVLFIEGGNIDLAHHLNKAAHALEEVYQFDKAVRVASKLLSSKNTLMVVTADHSHPFNVNGHPPRGKSILGTAAAADGSHHILSYASGPGVNLNYTSSHSLARTSSGASPALTTGSNSALEFPSLVRLASGVHSGEDVPIYATGPWAHLFTGTVEQSYLPYALSYAACIGPYSHRCAKIDVPHITSVNIKYIQERMPKPTEGPFLPESPIPQKINIIAPNQIEFTRVLNPPTTTTPEPNAAASAAGDDAFAGVTSRRAYAAVRYQDVTQPPADFAPLPYPPPQPSLTDAGAADSTIHSSIGELVTAARQRPVAPRVVEVLPRASQIEQQRSSLYPGNVEVQPEIAAPEGSTHFRNEFGQRKETKRVRNSAPKTAKVSVNTGYTANAASVGHGSTKKVKTSTTTSRTVAPRVDVNVLPRQASTTFGDRRTPARTSVAGRHQTTTHLITTVSPTIATLPTTTTTTTTTTTPTTSTTTTPTTATSSATSKPRRTTSSAAAATPSRRAAATAAAANAATAAAAAAAVAASATVGSTTAKRKSTTATTTTTRSSRQNSGGTAALSTLKPAAFEQRRRLPASNDKTVAAVPDTTGVVQPETATSQTASTVAPPATPPSGAAALASAPDESLAAVTRRRKVIKLYVPRTGKFSNGLDKRSGLVATSV